MTKKSNHGASLFKETSIDKWAALLSEYNIQHERKAKNNQIQLTCVHPDHNDSHPSAYINVEYGNYHCWACNNPTVYDPIKVVELITQQPYGACVHIFSDVFGIQPSTKLRASNETDWQDKQFLNDVVDFGKSMLMQTFMDKPESPAVTWLKSRNISYTDLELFSIGILVPRELIVNLAQVWFYTKGRPLGDAAVFAENYRLYFGKVDTMANQGALLFPHFVTPSSVGRIQIRVDFLYKNPVDVKFFFVTPGDAVPDHITRLFDCPTGFFALDTWGRTVGKHSGFSIGATEGATDTIACYKAQLDKFGHVTFPSIALPGTGSADELDSLTSFGIEELRFLQDHPSARGDSVVGVYIKQSKKVDIKPLRWPSSVQAKDICQLYLTNGASAVCDLIFDEKNYESAHEHVLRIVQERLGKEGAGPERVHKILEESIGTIGAPSAQRAFIDAAGGAFVGVSPKELSKNVVLADDSMEGFIARLRADIMDKFEFLYKQRTIDDDKKVSTSVAVRTLHSTRIGPSIALFDINGSALVDAVMEPFGDRIEWALRSQMPSDVLYKKKGKGGTQMISPTSIRKELTACVKCAIEGIVCDIEELYDPFEKCANGIHRVEAAGTECILVVNGKHRFLGKFNASNCTIQWEDYLPNKISIEDEAAWSSHLSSVEDLNSGNTMNPRKLWDDVYRIINTGWAFRDQEADSIWLTGLALYSSIYDFSTRTLMTSITGDRHSGKSKLVKEFFGGQHSPGSMMPSLESYLYLEFPQTSEAGIRQDFGGSAGVRRRGLVLDEFENDSLKSHSRMDSVLALLRGMLDGDSTVKKGTTSGKSRTYSLRFPVIMAGILEYNDQTGAVVSRMYRIEMKHIHGRISPWASIQNKYPGESFTDVTRRTTLCMLRFAQKARSESVRILEMVNQHNFVLRRTSRPISDRTMVSAAVIGGILSVCSFSYNEIEEKLLLLVDKMYDEQEVRTILPGEKLWQDLLSMIVPLPERPSDTATDFFENYRQRLNRVSLNDALYDPYLRQYIGLVDFFQAFKIFEDKWMVIDQYYLRQYLKQENMDWIQFCTLMERNFECLSTKEVRNMAYRHGAAKYWQPNKKLLCIRIPREFTDTWEEYQSQQQQETKVNVPSALSKGPGVKVDS